MPDQTPQISLDPNLFTNPPTQPAVPAAAASSAGPSDVPLQPVPPLTAMPAETEPVKPTPQPLPSAPEANTQDRRSAVQAELERLQQEENSLLNNIKDWLTKVQGAETRQQILERELFELDRELSAGPTPEQAAADRRAKLATYTEQLQQAETKIKEITKLQKIDEKKAFDNYSAGGLDRQGLLEEMEAISQRYADQLAAVQKIANSAQQAITNIDQPAEPLSPATSKQPKPMTSVGEILKPAPTVTPAATPSSTPEAKTPAKNNLLSKLANMPEAKTGLLHHLVVEFPQQGNQPLIERSSDGTGIILRQDQNAQLADRCYIADADLLRAGATPEDIIPLPTSTLSAQEATSLTPVAELGS